MSGGVGLVAAHKPTPATTSLFHCPKGDPGTTCMGRCILPFVRPASQQKKTGVAPQDFALRLGWRRHVSFPVPCRSWCRIRCIYVYVYVWCGDSPKWPHNGLETFGTPKRTTFSTPFSPFSPFGFGFWDTQAATTAQIGLQAGYTHSYRHPKWSRVTF